MSAGAVMLLALLNPRLWLAVWGALLVCGPVRAQSDLPGAPTIDKVEAGRSATLSLTLTVEWTAPTETGGSAISAYDVRFIETAADETVAANWTVVDDAWTSGDLSYTLSRLTDSTGYDVQVRAVNATGDGAWSATSTGASLDHGDTAATATALPLDTAMAGVIAAGGSDEDYFTFTLTETTGLLVWTSGDLDTVGQLQDGSGTEVASNDDSPFVDSPFAATAQNFLLWKTPGRRDLSASRCRAPRRPAGPTSCIPGRCPDTSGIADAQDLAFDPAGDVAASGILDSKDDIDYFKLELAARTDLVIRTTGLVGDTRGTLLDSNGGQIASNDDGQLWPSRFQFLLRTRLAAGTYYIAVSGYDEDDSGLYVLHVNPVTEPGDTRDTALTLDFAAGLAAGGRLDSANDEDYFRLDLTAATTLVLGAVSSSLDIDGAVLDADGEPASDADGKAVALHKASRQNGPWLFFRSVRLAAGTYYLKVTPSGAGAGPYTLRALAFATLLAVCSDIATPVHDPLYGCQWHLSPTVQAKGTTPDADINVATVWEANNLGQGINVAVVDDGIDHGHEDLSANVDTERSHDYTGRGLYDSKYNHGTAVAGIVAAQANRLGGRGVAPQVKIFGHNLLLPSSFTDKNIEDAMLRNLADTAVSNNSWGPTNAPGLSGVPAICEMAIERGISEGFGGKGIFYVFAAGNGHPEGDNSNYSEYSNHYGVTAVCAVNDQGQRATYSEHGANLWVCAPSGDYGRSWITTTDNGSSYTLKFGGTSASSPIVAGVVALVRAANSALSWREVKLILAASARKTDPDNTGWQAGALKYGSTTARYHFNHEYGFGLVNAKAAVELAATWTPVPKLVKASAASAPFDGGSLTIPASGAQVETSVTQGTEVEFVEFVEINTDFDHLSFRNLRTELVSPSGAVSVLSLPNDDETPYDKEKCQHPARRRRGALSIPVTDPLPVRLGQAPGRESCRDVDAAHPQRQARTQRQYWRAEILEPHRLWAPLHPWGSRPAVAQPRHGHADRDLERAGQPRSLGRHRLRCALYPQRRRRQG